MNGAGPRGQPSYGYDGGQGRLAEGIVPSGKTLVQGYRTDLQMAGFGSQQPRFNPVCASPPAPYSLPSQCRLLVLSRVMLPVIY